MNTICVFCGSNSGNHPLYKSKAIELGELLAKKDITLTYGGGNIGLMGVIADVVLANHGEVIGVIPHFLAEKEVGHTKITKMYHVESMHERKRLLSDLSEGFIAMPGGIGTLEELSEILTWAQLGLVAKPIGLLNVNQFFNPLLSQLDHMVLQGFLKKENRNLLIDEIDPKVLLNKMKSYEPAKITKWIEKDQT